MDLFSPASARIPLGDDCWCEVRRAWLAPDGPWMTRLLSELPLRQETIVVYGKAWPTPRLTSLHGDPGLSYRWSGRTFVPSPWTAALAEVRARLLETTGVDYNAVMANHYRDGRDAMGAHADDEPELGPSAPHDVLIASVSLGAPRRFVLKPNPDGPKASLPPLTLELGRGDLLVMGGATQRDFRHHVPRTSRPIGPRLNLTFRMLRA